MGHILLAFAFIIGGFGGRLLNAIAVIIVFSAATRLVKRMRHRVFGT